MHQVPELLLVAMVTIEFFLPIHCYIVNNDCSVDVLLCTSANGCIDRYKRLLLAHWSTSKAQKADLIELLHSVCAVGMNLCSKTGQCPCVYGKMARTKLVSHQGHPNGRKLPCLPLKYGYYSLHYNCQFKGKAFKEASQFVPCNLESSEWPQQYDFSCFHDFLFS